MNVLGHAFTMMPTEDLQASIDAWRSAGLKLLWRPDGETALLGIAGRAAVMTEDDDTERGFGPGPVLLVDNVAAASTEWIVAPIDVPVGRYAVCRAGNAIVRLLDLSTCDPDRLAWFGG